MDGVDPTFNQTIEDRGYNIPYEKTYRKVFGPLLEEIQKNVSKEELEEMIKDNNWVKRFPRNIRQIYNQTSVKLSELKDSLKKQPIES